MSSSKSYSLNFRNVKSVPLDKSAIDSNPTLNYLSVTKQLMHQAQSRTSAVIKTNEYFNLKNHSKQIYTLSHVHNTIKNSNSVSGKNMFSCVETTASMQRTDGKSIDVTKTSGTGCGLIAIAKSNKLIK